MDSTEWGGARFQREVLRGRRMRDLVTDAAGEVVKDRRIYRDKTGLEVLSTTLGRGGEFVSSVRSVRDARGLKTAIEFINADGALTDAQSWCARVEYGYDEQGNLVRKAYFDAVGEPVTYRGAPGGHHEVRLEWDSLGRRVGLMRVTADGGPVAGVTEERFAYDDAGHMVLWERIAGTGGTLGWYPPRWRWEVDARGRWLRAWATDHNDDPYTIIWTDHPDVALHRVERDLDARGRPTRFEVFAADGSPSRCESGYSRVDLEYDDVSRRVRALYSHGGERVLTTPGVTWGPMFAKWMKVFEPPTYDMGQELLAMGAGQVGIAGFELELDTRSRPVKLVFLATDGRPTAVDGLAGARIGYGLGHRTAWLERIGSRGEPVENSRGWARWSKRFDTEGRVVATRWSNAKGADVDWGYTEERVLRADDGAWQGVSYWLGDGRPGENAEGCHRSGGEGCVVRLADL